MERQKRKIEHVFGQVIYVFTIKNYESKNQKKVSWIQNNGKNGLHTGHLKTDNTCAGSITTMEMEKPGILVLICRVYLAANSSLVFRPLTV